jgi:hypothetical protein
VATERSALYLPSTVVPPPPAHGSCPAPVLQPVVFTRMLTLISSDDLCSDRCFGLQVVGTSGLEDRGQLKCDGTRTETRFLLSAKRTSPFKSAGASVQSTTGSRGVRISGSNAGYTKFRGSVKSTGYPLHSPVSPSLAPVRHRVPSHFNWRVTQQLTTSVV